MSKREKIILLITVIALIYGLYTLLFGSSTKKSRITSENQVADIKKLVSDVKAGLDKGKFSKVEGYIMDRAKTPWPRDPFLQREAAETEKVVEEVKEEVNFVYSGYVALGSTKLAIINGKEYRAGETLEEVGYMLRKILPERVLIKNKKSRKNIIVPHQDGVITDQSLLKGDR